ncbi:MAG: amidohydrolase family protein [Candidatus Hodarchaeota archaeon]
MDILIKNGTIIDGTGSPGYQSDILIKEDKILKIDSNIDVETNVNVIDASNKIVAPGFIDIHNHADFNIFDATKAESFVMQGMTTLLVGLCGTGIAPTSEVVEKYYSDFMSKALSVEPKLFENLQQVHNVLKREGISINLAFLVPHGNVRACVLGLDMRRATEKELEKMKKLVEQNMEFGAFGLSTGLVYPPGSATPTEELIELSKIVSEYDGIYDSHMRNEGDGVIDIGMNELIRIAREANVRAHISHWAVVSRYKYKKLTPEAINLVEKAHNEGLQITADVVPYDDGVTNLAYILLETWVFENLKENLNNLETRARIKKEIFERIFSMFVSNAPFYLRLIPKFLIKRIIYKALSKRVHILYTVKSHQFEGKTLYEALTKLYPDKKIEDALLDFIRDEDGGVVIRHQLKNEEKSVIPLYKQPYVCPSSDASLITRGNSHPRAFGAFPRVIQRWVREKGIINLEEAIRKMTSLPASILGITDRGVLKEGNIADIVVFDFKKIEEKGTIENGCQHPEGIDYVIINGEITVSEGKHLGVLKGRVLKHLKK